MRPNRLFCMILALILLAVGCRKKSTTTQLHEAARKGNIEQVRSLISNGADVNVKGSWDGGTPLHHANLKVAELLIAHGADVNTEVQFHLASLASTTRVLGG